MKKKTTIFLVLGLLLYSYQAVAEKSAEVEKKAALASEDQSLDEADRSDFFFGYLNLTGTVLVSEKDRNLNKAIFQDAFSGRKVTYHEGDLLPYGIELIEVGQDGVVLAKGRRERTLFLGEKTNYFPEIKSLRRYGYRLVAPNEWVVNSHYLFRSSEELINIAVTSGLEFNRSKKNPGIKIAGKTNSKIARLGFKKGDKVVGINGTSLDGLMGLASAYKKMKSSENITIKILRNGKPVQLNYWVAKRGAPRYNMRQVLASDKIRKMLSM